MANRDEAARNQSRSDEIDRYRDEMDWDQAESRPGKSHGVVVSVRLDEGEAERLRSLASDLDLNMSQVLRRALASFDPTAGSGRMIKAILAYQSAFTFGGANFLGRLSVRPEGVEGELELSESGTVETRVRERIPA